MKTINLSNKSVDLPLWVILTLISVLLSYVITSARQNLYINSKEFHNHVRSEEVGKAIEEIKPTAQKLLHTDVSRYAVKVTEPTIQEAKPIEQSARKVESLGEDDALQSILEGYSRHNSHFTKKQVSYVYQLSLDKKLDPKLVLAVMALESGWGKSHYCKNKGNCFGYGYTDSGKVGNYEGDFYKVTEVVLSAYKRQGYGVGSPKLMASRGYNFHTSWVNKVNYIMDRL